MKYHIKKSDSYSVAKLSVPISPIVRVVITVDLHSKNSLTTQATELVYSEALMSGNKKYTRAEFLNEISLLGSDIDVTINNSILTVRLLSRTEHFQKTLKLLEDMLTGPTFAKKELARIKSTIANELHEAKDDSKYFASAGFRNTIYGKGDRKYTYDLDDTAREIKSIGSQHLKKLHQVLWSKNWVSTIYGNEDDCNRLERFIDRIKSGTSLKNETVIHEPKKPSQTVVLRDIPSRSNIDFSIGAPIAITLKNEDLIPLGFALTVLGKVGGFSGRLMSTVRELEGLTYGIYAQLEGFSKTEQGYFRIMTFFAPDKALQGITSTFREVKKMYEKGITSDELQKFKSIIGTQEVLLKDSPASLLNDLHYYHLHGFSLAEMAEHKSKIKKLTLQEVNNTIKKYLDPTRLTISGAGPIKVTEKDIRKFIKSVK